MHRRRLAKLFIFWLILFSAVTNADNNTQLRFAWFAELYPEHTFWKQHWAFSQAAATDLGVQLSPFYINTDQVKYKQSLNRVIQPGVDDTQYDGLIFINIKHQEQAIMSIINQGDLPGISNVLPMDYDKVGQPRENYKQWVGEVLVDEVDSGYQLASKLIEAARKQKLVAEDGRIHLLAIAGNKADAVGIRREQGLAKALAENPDVFLEQKFYATHWSSKESRLFTTTGLRRYPYVSVVWSANDDIAIGVIESARELGRIPGENILTGGVDGTLDMINMVASGDAVCTVSGLFMHGGWATILLYDYLNQKDFTNDTGNIIHVNNTVVDQKLAGQYLRSFGDGDWQKIDFSKFSKVHNPQLKRYDFSIEAILAQIKANQANSSKSMAPDSQSLPTRNPN